jgi:hypothetical protein
MLLKPDQGEPNHCGSGSTTLPVAILVQYKVFKNISAFRAEERQRERERERERWREFGL